jgi:hypothetical protein
LKSGASALGIYAASFGLNAQTPQFPAKEPLPLDRVLRIIIIAHKFFCVVFMWEPCYDCQNVTGVNYEKRYGDQLRA